jgi:hypothetical protein
MIVIDKDVMVPAGYVVIIAGECQCEEEQAVGRRRLPLGSGRGQISFALSGFGSRTRCRRSGADSGHGSFRRG